MIKSMSFVRSLLEFLGFGSALQTGAQQGHFPSVGSASSGKMSSSQRESSPAAPLSNIESGTAPRRSRLTLDSSSPLSKSQMESSPSSRESPKMKLGGQE